MSLMGTAAVAFLGLVLGAEATFEATAESFQSDWTSFLLRPASSKTCTDIASRWIRADTQVSMWGKVFAGKEGFEKLCLNFRNVKLSNIRTELVYINPGEFYVGYRSLLDGLFLNSGNTFTDNEIFTNMEWNPISNTLESMTFFAPEPEEWLKPMTTRAVKLAYNFAQQMFSGGIEQTLALISNDAVFEAPNLFFYFGLEGEINPNQKMTGKGGFVALMRGMQKVFDFESAKSGESRKILFSDDKIVITSMQFKVKAKLTGKEISGKAIGTHVFNEAGQLVMCSCVLEEPIKLWDVIPWTTQDAFSSPSSSGGSSSSSVWLRSPDLDTASLDTARFPPSRTAPPRISNKENTPPSIINMLMASNAGQQQATTNRN